MKNGNKNRVGIFVDVQNIYYTTREVYQRSFNYKKFWQKIAAEGEIVLANAYAIERNNSQQQKFQNALRTIGFKVKLKPYIQRSDGSAKGDWDVGITIDMLEAANQIDTAILLSGDGDFDLLLEKLNLSYQINTEVYGISKLTANALKNAAKTYHPITSELLL